MDGVFDLPMKGFLFGEHSNDSMDDEKYESSPIESGKREKVENSKIDTYECRDEKDDRKSHFRIEEINEEIAYGNRSAETLYRFGSFSGNSRSDNPFCESSEKLQSHRRLSISLNPPFFQGFKKAVFITEVLTDFRDIMSHITSYFPIFGSDQKSPYSPASLYSEVHNSRGLLHFHNHIFRTQNSFSINREKDVSIQKS